MKFLKRALVVALLIGTTATGVYLHAEEPKPKPAATAEQQKAREEFRAVRKAEYLQKLQERERYHIAMAQEMKALRAACSGKDEAACKKAKAHSKATRETFRQSRQANSERFKAQAEIYRQKMGNAAPNAAEKKQQELKAKKPAAPRPAPAEKKD